MNKSSRKLNEFYATAICGNDILSSVLYVSGLTILFAGVYSPLVLLFVACILYLYKLVYTEVVEAIPVNGGVYNCLLNGTSKILAAIAGTTSFLSYMATAVLSAKVSMDYFRILFPGVSLISGSVVLLLIFALITLLGFRVSAKVSAGIFVFHIVTLIMIIILGGVSFFNGHSVFFQNFSSTANLMQSHGGVLNSLYLAFSISLLGVSGFESSANFVEEQEKGVFRKTLRNMLIGVTVFNPLIALVVLNVLPIEAVAHSKDFLLSEVGNILGGSIFKMWIALDAFLVLAGAIHTSYVGVSGLLSRMSYDGCLPQFLNRINKLGTYTNIILVFFVLCSSILIFTGGNIALLAGVYTVVFLTVMTLFGIGNMILRRSKAEIRRPYKAPLLFVALASLATFVGIWGNIRVDLENLIFFEAYFIPSVALVLVMVFQDEIVKKLILISKGFPKVHAYLLDRFQDLNEGKFIIFIHHARRLHEFLEYINRNETGWDITLIYCKDDDDPANFEFERIKYMLPIFKEIGIFSHLNLNLVYVDKNFDMEVVNEVSKQFKIRQNRIMIGSIHDFDKFDYKNLMGVRVIL